MGKDVSKRPAAAELRRFVLEAVAGGARDPVGDTARTFGISRQAVNGHLRRLVGEGLLEAHGATRGRRYSIRERVHRERFGIDRTLTEHRAWEGFVSPLLSEANDAVRRICQYGCTEMLNNAIEHSGGTHVDVQVKLLPSKLELAVIDDGIGVFKKIKDVLGLEDEQHAVLELSKGKLTTDPQHHTGEGIFFTSRAFDDFSILSGGLFLNHSSGDKDWLLETGASVGGTAVVMQLAWNSTRSLKEVFDAFASASRPFSFAVTHVPVSLATVGADNLVSRSQARRLVTRLDLFDEVVLNFSGVNEVGQAFTDEVFRVFASEHPGITIGWVGANESVESMIQRALQAKRDQTGGV